MKKYLAAAVLVVLAGAATAQAGVDVNVHLGVPVGVAPAPVVSYPSYQPYYVERPGFIYSPRLGFHVSVGLPYDVVYLDDCYYHYRDGRWYMSPSYGGSWSYVSYRSLPRQLHRHHHDEIRYHRDREYRSYLYDRDRYARHWYRPAGMHRHDRWEGRLIGRNDRFDDRRYQPRGYDRDRSYRYQGEEHRDRDHQGRDGRRDHGERR